MAAPNLKSPTTIIGEIQPYTCTTVLSAALTNAPGSNKAYRVNVLRAANTSTSGAVSVEVSLYRGTTHTYLVKGAVVNQASSFIILQRDEYIYLEEGDAIYAKASSNSSIDLLITYEEWS